MPNDKPILQVTVTINNKINVSSKMVNNDWNPEWYLEDVSWKMTARHDTEVQVIPAWRFWFYIDLQGLRLL